MHDPEAPMLSLCCDPIELAGYGPGYVIYFSMLKLTLFLCLVLGLVNIAKIYRNFHSERCNSTDQIFAIDLNLSNQDNTVCRKDWITYHSVANYGAAKYDYIDRATMGVFFAFYTIVIGLYNCYLEILSKRVKRESSTPANWTLAVRVLLWLG
jgi:hypothetical protein